MAQVLAAHTLSNTRNPGDEGLATMKLFIESLMIFFGTLIAAALVALGEPVTADLAIAESMTHGNASLSSQDDSQQHARTQWASGVGAMGPR